MKWLYLLLIVKVVIAQRDGIRLPAEWERHEKIFLCFPQSDVIWAPEVLPYVREDVARIANALVDYEPVVMLTDPEQVDIARALLDRRVSIVPMKVDDLWARDTLPVFVEDKRSGIEQLLGVIFNFNGWGNKQKQRENDSKLAGKVIEEYGMKKETADIVAEGGSFETDGKGTLLVTESSLVNTNRNEQTKEAIENELKNRLGIRKVIWFKGVKDEDITDAHVDCLVRFVRPGTVILNRSFPGKADVWSISSDDARNVLAASTDADGNRFEVIDLFEPDPSKITYKGDKKDFLSSYANFLIGNECVIVPAFGDKDADSKAQSTLRDLFPGRTIVPVQLGALSSGGGGIHCATHELPAINQKQ